MAAARGIAGSHVPELHGCFVCLNDFEVEWVVGLNTTGGPVDVWAVDGLDNTELRESSEGHYYVARIVSPRDVELVRRDIVPRRVR